MSLALSCGISVLLLSGLRSDSDVLRGEEVEIIGLAELLPCLAEGEYLAVMPGTHSKHIRIRDGRIIAFDTLMTGEMFAHLHSLPTLQMCLARGMVDANDAWFLQGVRESAAAGLAVSLFKIRARSMLQQASGAQNSAFLSGLLIGAELLCVPKDFPTYLAASEPLCALYLRTAEELGLEIRPVDAGFLKKATVAAHRRILRLLG